jgi:integrase
VRDWSRDDLRKVSRYLDAKIADGGLAWRTARNVWTTATRICRDAAESKIDALRVRTDNPAEGLPGPERGAEKGKQFLYPDEFTKFVSCVDVPIEWRELVTLAIHLYPRDAELRVLDVADVDLAHGTVHINKALDRRSGQIKATKGLRNRYVPIEPTVLPLLKAMAKTDRDGTRLITTFPSFRDMARGLRRWLKRAGVTRQELHVGTPTTVRLTFHDLRATGLTWMAVRGDDPLKIQRRAGHKDLEVTQRYIRLAEDLRNGFGKPFPALPSAALPSFPSTGESIAESITRTQLRDMWRGGRDSNPRPPA